MTKGPTKITREAYEEFVLDYFNGSKDYENLRFGQAFVYYLHAKHGITIEPNPDLFYTTNEFVADNIIKKQYLYD